MWQSIQKFCALGLSFTIFITSISPAWAVKRIPYDSELTSHSPAQRLQDLTEDLQAGVHKISKDELSPYQFEQDCNARSSSLTPLEQKVMSALLQGTRKRLQEFPAFLEHQFQKDIAQAIQTSSGPLMRSYLTYYKGLLRPFEYWRNVSILKKGLPVLRQQGHFPVPQKEYRKLKQKMSKCLKGMDETTFSKEIAELQKARATTPQPTSDAPSSLMTRFAQKIQTGTSYILDHPLKAITLSATALIPTVAAITATNLNPQTLNFVVNGNAANYTLTPVVVSEVNGTCYAEFVFTAHYVGLYGDLGFSAGQFISKGNSSLVPSFGNQDQVIQGATDQINAWLSSVYFVPKPHFNQNTQVYLWIWDDVLSYARSLSGTITLNAIPVSDPPIMTTNYLNIQNGQALPLTPNSTMGNSYHNYPPSFTFSISPGVQHGRFFLSNYPGGDLTSYTYPQLAGGKVMFAHDGSGLPPAYNISINDGVEMSAPLPATVEFTYIPVTGSPTNSQGGIAPTPPNNLTAIIAGSVTGGVAFLTGLTTAAICFAKKYMGNSPSLEMNIIDPMPSGFPRESTDIQWGYTRVPGQLTQKIFELFPDMNEPLAALIKNETGLKINLGGRTQVKDYTVGSGNFGKLKIARSVEKKKFIGVKTITGNDKIQESIHEVEMQNKAKGSPYVMETLDYHLYKPNNDDYRQLITEPTLFIFMELATFGNGTFFQQQFAQVPNLKLRTQIQSHVAAGMVKGVSYIHKKNMGHFDIHPGNVTFQGNGVPRIIDFGTAQDLPRDGKLRESELGNIGYFSPERWAYRRHLIQRQGGETIDFLPVTQSDTFSLGLALFEMFYNRHPFEKTDHDTMLNTWNYNKFNEMIHNLPELQAPQPKSIEALMKGFLVTDYKKRLGLDEALTWPILQQELSQEEGLMVFTQLAALEQISVDSRRKPPTKISSQVETYSNNPPQGSPYGNTSAKRTAPPLPYVGATYGNGPVTH